MSQSRTHSTAAHDQPVLRGQLYWLAPDSARDTIRHPHLVVQDDVFNASRVPTTIICALTTDIRKSSEPGNVLIEAGEAGLAQNSVVVVSRLSAVDKVALIELIGQLAPVRVEQVLAGLRFQQAAFLRGR